MLAIANAHFPRINVCADSDTMHPTMEEGDRKPSPVRMNPGPTAL